MISESYAMGTPWGVQLRYLGYLPSGILMMLFCFFAARALPKSALAVLGFLGLGMAYGLGTVMVSIFPCDEGCAVGVDPSMSQLIHNLSGLLTYLGAPMSLLLLGLAARNWPSAKALSMWGIGASVMGYLMFGLFLSDLGYHRTGLFQRLLEGSMLSFIVACSVYLLRTRNKMVA
jgi:hypothetical protein